MTKFCTFDLEIFDDLEEGKPYIGQGISCAAICYNHPDDDHLHITEQFYRRDDHARMTPDDVLAMLARIQLLTTQGYKLVTFNGLGFDFRVAAIEAGQDAVRLAARMAMEHIDVMFNVVCYLGWPVGLQQACTGMGLEGKVHEVTLTTGEKLTEMHGSKAPSMWRAGEHDAVLTYLNGDVISLIQLVEEIEKKDRLTWLSKSGKRWNLPAPYALYNVMQALKLPKPNTAWMTTPLTRESFIDWAGVRIEPDLDPDLEPDPEDESPW